MKKVKSFFLEKRKREERERLARRERDEQHGDTSREVEKKAKPSTKTVPKSEWKGGQGKSEASDDADANER